MYDGPFLNTVSKQKRQIILCRPMMRLKCVLRYVAIVALFCASDRCSRC